MKVLISARDFDGLIPNRRLQAELGTPMELDECRFAGVVDEAETMDTETFDHALRSRQRAVRHDPHHHVHGFRAERYEIPEGVVSSGRLRKAAVWFHLDGMNEIGEFDGILDEKNGNVVANEIPVTFPSVKLDGESAYVARRIDRTRAACDRRYVGKHGWLFVNLGKYPRGGELA